jgi:hypothetical protein
VPALLGVGLHPVHDRHYGLFDEAEAVREGPHAYEQRTARTQDPLQRDAQSPFTKLECRLRMMEGADMF